MDNTRRDVDNTKTFPVRDFLTRMEPRPEGERMTSQALTKQALRLIHCSVGWVVAVQLAVRQPRRNQRGLSQSTEYVILLAGAVAVAGLVIVMVRNYIKAHPLPEP